VVRTDTGEVNTPVEDLSAAQSVTGTIEGYVEIDIGGLRMKRIRLIIAALLTLALTVGMFAALGGEKAQAATKPAKAKVTAKANDDGTSVTLTIAKTKKAQGYQIMVKKPGAKKFTKLATISEDGTAKRTYTAEKLTEGEYQFKVRAYLKNGKKTVWGKYSKVAKVKVVSKEVASGLSAEKTSSKITVTLTDPIVDNLNADRRQVWIRLYYNDDREGGYEIGVGRIAFGVTHIGVVGSLYSGNADDFTREAGKLTLSIPRDEVGKEAFSDILNCTYYEIIYKDGDNDENSGLKIYGELKFSDKSETKPADNDKDKEKDKPVPVKTDLTLADFVGEYVTDDGGSMKFSYNDAENWYELFKIKYYASYAPYKDFEDTYWNWQRYMGVVSEDYATITKQSDGSIYVECHAYNDTPTTYQVTFNTDGTIKVVKVDISNGNMIEAVFHK
jgi:hypothetical protein